MACTSFAGSYGSCRVDAIPRASNYCRVAGTLRAQGDGLINDVAPMPLAAVADGLSHTLLVADRLQADADRLGAPLPAVAGRRGWSVSGNRGDTRMTAFDPPDPDDKVAALASETCSRPGRAATRAA